MQWGDGIVLWVIAVFVSCAVKPLQAVDESNGQIVCSHGALDGHTIHNGQRCWFGTAASSVVEMDSLIVEGTLEIGKPITGTAPKPQVVKVRRQCTDVEILCTVSISSLQSFS